MTLMDLHVDQARKEKAPDGSDVVVLASVDEGSTAVFELAAGAVARPVRHARVQEIWFVLSGHGQMWRRTEGTAGFFTDLVPGISLNIPRLTSFQFRCHGSDPLKIFGVTMPPWRGPEDAEILQNDGPWQPTV